MIEMLFGDLKIMTEDEIFKIANNTQHSFEREMQTLKNTKAESNEQIARQINFPPPMNPFERFMIYQRHHRLVDEVDDDDVPDFIRNPFLIDLVQGDDHDFVHRIIQNEGIFNPLAGLGGGWGLPG
jgi:hypothetical protein